mmetsp:Transcript_38216/g.71185  ORF Transcript_38216/g.71185 Transcript_38216/m.71185 type:complete len:163 (-) Transcript_38216:619-1107(-)
MRVPVAAVVAAAETLATRRAALEALVTATCLVVAGAVEAVVDAVAVGAAAAMQDAVDVEVAVPILMPAGARVEQLRAWAHAIWPATTSRRISTPACPCVVGVALAPWAPPARVRLHHAVLDAGRAHAELELGRVDPIGRAKQQQWRNSKAKMDNSTRPALRN